MLQYISSMSEINPHAAPLLTLKSDQLSTDSSPRLGVLSKLSNSYLEWGESKVFVYHSTFTKTIWKTHMNIVHCIVSYFAATNGRYLKSNLGSSDHNLRYHMSTFRDFTASFTVQASSTIRPEAEIHGRGTTVRKSGQVSRVTTFLQSFWSTQNTFSLKDTCKQVVDKNHVLYHFSLIRLTLRSAKVCQHFNTLTIIKQLFKIQNVHNISTVHV